ncbi:MAG: hypothetical protein Alpg2KO_32680 [Alphaproteobacteria bacterium]
MDIMTMTNRSKKFNRTTRGATLTGYGLVVGLIAIVALSAVTGLGSQTESLFEDVATTLGDVSGTQTAAAPAPSASAAAGTAFRYWGIYTDVNGNSDNATDTRGSFSELQFFYDGSMQSLTGLPGTFNSSDCPHSPDTALIDGSIPNNNTGLVYCDVFDVIIDLGSAKEVSQVGLAPQSQSVCYNVPFEVTVRGGNSPTGPFSYEETITIGTFTGTGNGVCPTGWSPASIASFVLP